MMKQKDIRIIHMFGSKKILFPIVPGNFAQEAIDNFDDEENTSFYIAGSYDTIMFVF